MPLICLTEVRSLAHRYGYAEIQCDDNSRVVALKSMDRRIRIRVYTTGTVATCLSHPFMGKTQLFRRNQSLDDLKALFQDPRRHTDHGYYKVSDYCDDELRWRFVVTALHGFCNEQQVVQISALCRLWNEIQFDKYGPFTIEFYNTQPVEIKQEMYSPCPDGNFCVLGSILIAVLRSMEQLDVELMAPWPSASFNKQFEDGPIVDHSNTSCEEEKKEKMTTYEDLMSGHDQFQQCKCEEGQIIRDELGNKLDMFKRQLVAFPKRIRRELIYFFLKKILPQYEIIICTKKERTTIRYIFEFKKGEKNDIYYAYLYNTYFLNDDVRLAHHDYSELTDTDSDDDCDHRRCDCVGVM